MRCYILIVSNKLQLNKNIKLYLINRFLKKSKVLIKVIYRLNKKKWYKINKLKNKLKNTLIK